MSLLLHHWDPIYSYLFWLVVWNIFFYFSMGNNHPNELIFIFFRGVAQPSIVYLYISIYIYIKVCIYCPLTTGIVDPCRPLNTSSTLRRVSPHTPCPESQQCCLLRNAVRKPWINGHFMILKWRYCTLFLAIIHGDIPWNLGLKNRLCRW